MKEYTIHLIGGEEDEIANITSETTEDSCKVEFHYRGKTISSEAFDCFSAFSEIREKLEKENLIPFCYGASLNVYPSGMCRDMGRGKVAYKNEMGKKASRDDLVPIFEEGADVIPASVKNQREHFEEWLESLKA